MGLLDPPGVSPKGVEAQTGISKLDPLTVTGYVFALVDQGGKLALGVRPDGTIVGRLAETAVVPPASLQGASVPAIRDQLEAFVLADQSNRKAFWINMDGSVDAVKLGPSLVAAMTTALQAAGFGAAAKTYQAPYGTATETKVVSGPDVVLVGHSMLAGASGAISAALTGKTTRSLAVGGETSRTIAARQGGQPATFTFTAGSIPASGPATITLSYADKAPLKDTDGGWPLLQGAASYTGWVVLEDGTGVAGTLSVVRDPAASPNVHHSGDVFSFTRATDGAAINVPRPVPFYYYAAAARREDIAVYWAGRNNITETDQVVADTQAMILHQTPLRPRYVVLSEHNGQAELPGSSVYIAATTLNARLRALYGRRFIDTRAHLIKYGLAEAGITATTDDLTDIGNDTVPRSLRADALHLNAAGSTVVASLIRRRLLELDWM